MHATYTITLPADTDFHSIWDSLIAGGFINRLGEILITAVKNNAIQTDRVCELQIKSQATGTDTITVSDWKLTGGFTMLATADPFISRSSRNSICLKDYYVKGSAASMPYTINVESI